MSVLSESRVCPDAVDVVTTSFADFAATIDGLTECCKRATPVSGARDTAWVSQLLAGVWKHGEEEDVCLLSF